MISPHHRKILDKATHIINMIRQSDEMNFFKQAEEKLNSHGDAQALLFVVRAKRNAYSQTSLRLGYEHPASIQAKRELDEVLTQMAEIPLIEQYQEAQEEVNEIIQGVTRTLLQSLSAEIPVEVYDSEAGGGCGGGCGSGSCGSGHCGH